MNQAQRIIIFEGPDGSGKSTMARAVADHYKFAYVHTGPPRAGVSAEDQYHVMLDALPRNVAGVVFDRFHLGERVYGPVFRSRDTLGDAGQFALERRMLDASSVLLVLCLPPMDWALGNWRARIEHEMLKDDAQWIECYHRYRQSYTVLPKFVLDVRDSASQAHLFHAIERMTR